MARADAPSAADEARLEKLGESARSLGPPRPFRSRSPQRRAAPTRGGETPFCRNVKRKSVDFILRLINVLCTKILGSTDFESAASARFPLLALESSQAFSSILHTMIKKFIPLSLALGFALTGVSSAAIVGGDTGTYTFTSSVIGAATSAGAGTTFSLQQFNASSLGFLTGVRVDLELNGWTGVYSFTPDAGNGDILSTSNGRATPSIVFATNPASGFPGPGTKVSATVSQNIVATDTNYTTTTTGITSAFPAATGSSFYQDNTPTALAWATTNGMIGGGTFDLKYASSKAQTFDTVDGTLTGGLSGNLKAFVTYTYTAYTPEPAGLLLGGAPALLGAAHLMRRRRR